MKQNFEILLFKQKAAYELAQRLVGSEMYIRDHGNTGAETKGLSQKFTQEKLHEGKILKQKDRELANDARKNNQTANEGGDK